MWLWFALVLILNFNLIVSYDLNSSDLLKDERNIDYGKNGWIRWEETEPYYSSWNSYQDYERKGDFNEERIRRLDKQFGFTGPTANDGPENLIRPCAFNDWQCIRNFFAANGKCSPSHGPIPDPLLLEVNTIFLPCVNLSITFIDYKIRGLSNAKVKDFYVNKKSGNLVLEVDLKAFNMTSPRAYFRYQRTGKESIVTADMSTVLFNSITLTVVIPKLPKLRLNQAESHFDVDDGMPVFKFGDKAFTSTDPDVKDAFAQLSGPLRPVCVRESFIFQPQLFAAAFIQKAICDFGLKLTSY